MALCAVLYPLYSRFRYRYAYTTETFQETSRPSDNSNNNPNNKDRPLNTARVKLLVNGFDPLYFGAGLLYYEAFRITQTDGEGLELGKPVSTRLPPEVGTIVSVNGQEEYEASKANSMMVKGKDGYKDVYRYITFDLKGVTEGDEICFICAGMRRLAYQCQYGDTTVYSSVSNTFAEHFDVFSNKLRYVNFKTVGCYKSSDLGRFKNASQVSAKQAQKQDIYPLGYAKENTYKYVLVPPKDVGSFYVMNDISGVSPNDIRDHNGSIFPVSKDAMMLYEITDRKMELSELPLPSFIQENKDMTFNKAKILELKESDASFATVIRITIPSPDARTKFCPDINYKEFNNEGCRSRLSKEACVGSQELKYEAVESLCTTLYDYRSSDPFKNYNDFISQSQVILRDFQTPFRSSVRGKHPDDSFGKQLEGLLRNAMEIASKSGYAVMESGMDSESGLPLLNSVSYYGVIENALRYVNNPLRTSQSSDVRVDRFLAFYKSVLMRLRSYRNADEFNKTVVKEITDRNSSALGLDMTSNQGGLASAGVGVK